jgi:hypothetical protein
MPTQPKELYAPTVGDLMKQLDRLAAENAEITRLRWDALEGELLICHPELKLRFKVVIDSREEPNGTAESK